MKYDQLSSAFENIGRELELPEYLKEICSRIAAASLNREKVDEILNHNQIHYSIAKVEFLKLIFEYITRALKDDILTIEEKEDIKFLKIWFRIKPGDFYYHNKPDIEKVISYQLSKIYQDSFVSNDEALLKVDLQEVFDLNFDQMNEYSKTYASNSIRQGANPNELDVYFSHKEYFKLKSPIN